jgi:hypothetical protein
VGRSRFPQMQKGMNCSFVYDPINDENCSKCSHGRKHHEFDCVVYSRYNASLCSLCEKGHHFASECKELSKFPLKSSELNALLHNLHDAKN